MLKFPDTSATGIYTGLNVAVNWDKVDIKGPVYIGGMTQIEDGAKIVDRR